MSTLAGRARATALDLVDVPLPAGGRTPDRLAALRDVGADDLSLARLVEPHLDAVAILAEAGRQPAAGGLYGVWASSSPSPPRLERGSDGSLLLQGRQPFGGGATICDAVLLAVEPVAGDPAATDDGAVASVMIEIDLAAGRDDGTIEVDPTGWRSPAFGRTGTSDVRFLEHVVSEDQLVGTPGWYLARPGFWHGALGPAAVWAGGAEGLWQVAESLEGGGPHRRAALGEIRALTWAMRAQLDAAGREVDADPADVPAARRRALTVRHLIERQCAAVVDLFGRTMGPRPLAFDDAVITRIQELQLYIRQVHHGDDLEELGAASPRGAASRQAESG